MIVRVLKTPTTKKLTTKNITVSKTVSGNNVREGIADTDDGTGHVIVGEAVCLVKGAAGDETVREKCTGFKFLLHMNTS